jgi:two-component system, OmpR family, sensor kinase
VARPWSLQTRLIAAVLALLAASLAVIGVVSYVELKRYVHNRVDSQLNSFAAGNLAISFSTAPAATPTNWILAFRYDSGDIKVASYVAARSQPPWPSTAADVDALPNSLYTVRAPDGTDWRMVALAKPGGTLFVGESLTDAESIVKHMVIIELLVGGATLLVLSAVGAGLIRRSLRPLTAIESTAAAITAGDLTRRVPEIEPYAEVPRTEVGTLGRSINTMLGQIETAFRARAQSEAVARHAAIAAGQAAEAAHQSETRAKRSEERMRQFAADASHELRTPLTSIRGFAELYRQGAVRDDEQVGQLMRRIESEAQRMGLLVDDLLLLARMDQERPLEAEPVDLRVVAGDAVTAAEAVAPERPISLEVEPGSGPLVVTGDELRLRQMVGNLVTNALTYTPPESPIVVRLSARRNGAEAPEAGPPSLAQGYAEIAVVDAGPGLEPEQASRIFERFYRGDSARTHRPRGGQGSGAGLGLAIVAALVRAHGGTVEVASTPGEGATFRVRLPLETPHDPEPADQP